jgi:hypothetical protein
MTSSYRNLRPADPDALQKWRESHDEQEARFKEELAREKQHAQHTQHASWGEIETLRKELHSEIATLRAEADQRANVYIEAVGEVIGTLQKEITAHVERVFKDTQNRYRDIERELFRSVERRFGELAGRLDALAPDARSRAKGEFQFANERPERDDEPVELPNPLPTRRAIN